MMQNLVMEDVYDINQKTIFVLDHTQYFSISSENYIPLDFLKGKISSPESLSGSGRQFSKSLWTCSVEASIEYCRIAWDVFPHSYSRKKLVRFIVSDTAAHIVNTWALPTQNSSHVLNAMALVGVPQRATATPLADFSVVHGLRAAIEALAEPTEEQAAMLLAMQQKLESGEKNLVMPPNKGRVICITSTRNNASMKNLEEIFRNALQQQNAIVASAPQKKFLHIDHCHLVLVNVVPSNVECLVTPRAYVLLAPILSTEIHITKASDISNKLTHLIMSHYDLASTTVTGIPMKEEQNANSSANYDVEILHARKAHTAICGNESLLPTSIKEGSEYETVTLKWSTPRTGSSDMLACLAQHRVTPVDVTSRPSSCLINFLLNGRSVLLEMPRKSGGKTTSHLLSARGGEIFIHPLQITRSCLEDPPAITDGPGGRNNDYRVSDLVAFAKAHRFFPLKSKPKPDKNLSIMRDRVMRRSRYFPLTSNSSMIFVLQRNIEWIPYFLRSIMKEDMDSTDERQCQACILELFTAATRGESLPFPNLNSSRLKGSKKIEQYRLLCSELEAIIKAYSTTPHHKAVLESVQNVRAACCDNGAKSESDTTDAKNIIRATTDSPLSPPHSMDSNSGGSSLLKAAIGKQRNLGLNSGSSTRTLLDIFTAAERSQSAKRLDFTGRLLTAPGQIAKLYPNFVPKEKEAPSSSLASLNTTTTAQGILSGTGITTIAPTTGIKEEIVPSKLETALRT